MTNISGQYLVKKYLGEQLSQTTHWGLNKDGTQRKKVKIIDTAITTDTGHVLPLVFRKVAGETAADIMANTRLELE